MDNTKQTDTPTVNTSVTTDDKGKQTDKVLTQETLDTAIAERLARAEEKHKKELAEAIKKATEEATRLATLTAEEKQQELTKKQLGELQEKERQLALRENKLEAIEMLSALNIPIKFAEQLTTTDLAETKAKIEVFAKEWAQAIEQGVAKQVAGTNIPKDLTTKQASTPLKAVTSF